MSNKTSAIKQQKHKQKDSENLQVKKWTKINLSKTFSQFILFVLNQISYV